MLDIFLLPVALPFSIALCVVIGLFLLEIASLLLGGSVMAMGSDAPDVDIDLDADFDFDPDVDLDVDVDVDGVDADFAPSGLLGWLGLGQVPFLIWLVSFLTMFGLFGLILQSGLMSVIGWALPALVAVALVMVPALYVTRGLSTVVAAIMPKTESSALAMRHLGGCHGTITQGTARRGSPAEAKIKDRYGNFHYLRVEPLDEDEEIAQGRSVHVMRRRDGRFFVVDIT